MLNLDFQTLESSYTLAHDITHETWFVTRRGLLRTLPPVRREVYKLEDGSVVAFRDTGIDMEPCLHMDEEFIDFFKCEPEMDVILGDQGMTDLRFVKPYRME